MKKYQILIIVAIFVCGIGSYALFAGGKNNTVACTQEAKICPDGSSVGRTGPDCEFTQCPLVQTAGWKTQANTQYGFELKYPAEFFDAVNQEPKILVGDCDYTVFPEACPNINDLVAKDMTGSGGDIKAVSDNLASPNYWQNSGGEKSTINDATYCLYQTEDAATGHHYDTYYYTTVVNKQCLVVNFSTSATDCSFYLPIEKGNTQQQQNYDNCITTNQNQPKIINQIVSTFKFGK